MCEHVTVNVSLCVSIYACVGMYTSMSVCDCVSVSMWDVCVCVCEEGKVSPVLFAIVMEFQCSISAHLLDDDNPSVTRRFPIEGKSW